jgi:hypothetical protein
MFEYQQKVNSEANQGDHSLMMEMTSPGIDEEIKHSHKSSVLMMGTDN